jgi:hypothetical protein
MTTQPAVPPKRVRLLLATQRTDTWWLAPVGTLIVLTTFICYATWAALQGNHYTFGPYLSPFYSPEIFGTSPHAWFGPPPSFWPSFVPFSPAMLILWAPAGFRFTCYYYRGAYYKAFWADPPACAVSEPRKSYWGERSFPLIIQNIHRYFLYVALVFIFLLAHDVWKAMWFDNGFGIGVGTLVLLLNTTLLGLYTFSCHSLRHLVGGRRDSLPKNPVGRSCYECVSSLNRRHMYWAWCSLFSVMSADLYVRLCSMGVIHDWRII